MVQAMHLQRALEIAKGHGLEDLLEELMVRLQDMKPEDFDLKTISSHVKISTEDLQKIIDGIVGTEGIEDALQKLGARRAPGGTPEQIDQTVADLQQSAPLQFLITQVVLSSDESTALLVADTPREASTLGTGPAASKPRSLLVPGGRRCAR